MPRKSRKNVGLIGLGIIGSEVAAALRHGGFHVYVWNRSPKAAPNFLASPAAVAELCDVIQIFVADAQALFDVFDAMEEKLTEQHVIICNATVGPEATIEAAQMVEARGAKFLDAPFTGSKPAAENRQLIYYIGGDDAVLKRVEPMLKASSKEIVKIGQIGQAATVKVVTNMLGAVTVQTLAEVMAIVKQSGIEPGIMVEALEHHGVRSSLLDLKLGQMLHRDFAPLFSMKHMFKDVQLAIHIANSLDLDIPATTATAGVMYGGLSRGWGDLDFAALAKIYDSDPPEPGNGNPTSPEPVKATEEAPPKETLSHLAPAPPRPEAADKIAEVDKTVPAVASENSPEALAEKIAEATQPTAGEIAPTPAEADEHKLGAHLNRIRRWFGTDAS